MEDKIQTPAPIAFKAETRQLLNILIHSLYTEREIFLRELISNASDALTRIDFELLTNREVLDPDAELNIRLIPDKETKTLTIRDSGIGMTSEELITNLGTIAQSGAREFIAAVGDSTDSQKLSDLIGQFGVGFYSAFMVADKIEVLSRSYKTDAQAARWTSDGSDTFTVEPDQKEQRGTDVVIYLKEDASEFLEEHRLRSIIRRHSDFIPFPIFIGEETEQTNRQTAIWRQSPREVQQADYEAFYQQLTLDFEPPITHAHMVVDAPVQMYAILFVPSSPQRGPFALPRDEGLKLYARKVLIQESNKDLLPEYLGFVGGVVDSEDIPLNVSRESVQSNRVMAQLKKLLTSKVLDSLTRLSREEPDKYARFWKGYSRYIKHGVAVETSEPEELHPLLRFRTTSMPDAWSSLDEYVERMKDGQSDIYYIMGDDEHSILYSPHLDVVRHYEYEVLLMTDPVDAFMLSRLREYKEHKLVNVAAADLQLPEPEKAGEEADKGLDEGDYALLIERVKGQLGDKVSDVRMTGRLSDSPARLVDPQGVLSQEMQRMYRLLDREYQVPKKVMELNPRHPIIVGLNALSSDDPLSSLVIEQVYEDALLIEGLHPNPGGMISRIQKLIEAALG